jgi:predicted AlkP superfamily phosphohydrolase/phosphomutase
MKQTKEIILGIDGIPFELMDDLSEKGVMPNFFELKRNYYFSKLESSVPHISSVSWSSIITGRNPGEHGIYGFMDMIEGTYSLSFPNYNSLQSKPFWESRSDRKNIILNVPSTYPAKKINGVHISGFVALELEKAIFPKKIIKSLKDMNYQIDVDTQIAKKQSENQFLNELFRVLEIRKKTYQFLWNNYAWDTFMFVITSSDRLGHYLWHIYKDEDHELHDRFLEFFTEIDNIIGEIVDKIREEDKLIILSDHGMELIKKNINLNTYLQQEGFLNLDPSESSKKFNRLSNNSKAFVLDPGRIYLNKKSKYPRGSVSQNEEKELMEQLKQSLYDLSFENKPVIKKVYEKDEIYHGKTIHKAPDLICVENSGFRLKGAIGKEELFESDIFTGKHNPNAFLLINKNLDIKNPKVEDIVGLLND